MSTARVTFQNSSRFFKNIKLHPGLIFGLIIIAALFFFEIFNYSTTDFALKDLLGDLRFAGIRWSTTLAIAFCAIDFAGIARLFTPTNVTDEPKEAWYLFGAWLLAATMNAALTWWGVAMAISNHTIQGAMVFDQALALKIVPVFVAILVWTIRVLIIGTISLAGNRMFTGAAPRSNRQPVPATHRVDMSRRMTTSSRPTIPVTARRPNSTRPTITVDTKLNSPVPSPRPTINPAAIPPRPAMQASSKSIPASTVPRPTFTPAPKVNTTLTTSSPSLPVTREESPIEPTYHSLSVSANSNHSIRIGENSASNQPTESNVP